MDEPTLLQQRVFDFVSRQLAEGQSAPTMREIAAHFRWKSKRAAECHVEALIHKGWLEREPSKARSLRILTQVPTLPKAVVQIPLFGSIPAGFGADREQDADECTPVTIESVGFKPTRNTFALRVRGDSMIGRHICDGDVVLLEHGPDPRHGQIVAALIDRKSTLKTFLLKGGSPS